GLTQLDPATTTGALGVGTQQLIEIAAALAADCSILILDEPTAALTAAEIDTLFERVAELKARGVCVVYVSHRLEEIKTLCDRFSVLCDGRFQGTRATAGTDTEQMVALMAGADTTGAHNDGALPQFQTYATSRPALKLQDLCAGPLVNKVSLTVHQGERVGIAGLVGSGRSELLRTIFGAESASSGTLTIDNGAPRRPFTSPGEAVAAGLALVTEDRKLDGLMLAQSVQINASISSLPHRWGWIDSARESSRSSARCTQLAVKYHDIDAPIDQLSGGNQQKVVLAKWLETGARLLLLDEPTRGIDVAARRQIEALFATLAARGHGLLIVSSDIDELLGTCDTIFALSEGRLIARFERATWTREAVMEAALGDHRDAAPTASKDSVI
ncbi:MAG: sugar ABC transporter ATP-binding protein, partial [Pseudomonadales bacterium]